MSGKRAAPTGVVTFLFTDIEGSTARWERDPNAMEAAVRRHDALMRDAFERGGGHVFKTVGDAFYVAFESPVEAVAAAYDAQRAVLAEDWTAVGGLRVRMAVHVGAAESRDGDYFGRPLNRVARIVSVGHGGQILMSSSAADCVFPALPNGRALRDLGSHRLKDLENAERIYQLDAPGLPTEFPRLRSLEEKPNNLPVQANAFIGRARELGELRERFKDTRVLTLLGFGGVGKTRLALQFAAETIDRFADGAWFIDLSPVANADVVADETARTIGAPATRDQTGTQAVVAALRDKETMLVFDGAEHVLQAVAELVDAILRSCRNVRVIVTSRQALDVPGETVHAVDTFELPPETVRTAEEALRYPAVQLLMERCAAGATRFTLDDASAPIVAEICRRLDGIALAIELAAPKLAVLTPQQLASRLRDRLRLLAGGKRTHLPRQQTLRALIDWSYDLLGAEERIVLRRLSVFAGPWTLEAATAICSTGEYDEWRVLDLCSALVSKSLIASDAGPDVVRFRMLDSIRGYAREKLAEAEETEAVTGRLVAFYATFLDRLDAFVEERDATAWRESFLPEIDNVRAALEWSIGHAKDVRGGRAILERLEWSQPAMTPRATIRWYDLAVPVPDPFPTALDEARFYRQYVRLAWLVGRPVAWREMHARRELEAARRSHDPVAIAQALCQLAICFGDAGRLDQAESTFEEALSEPLPVAIESYILQDRAVNDLERGDLAGARRRFERASQLAKPDGTDQGIMLLNLAEAEFALGNFDQAREAGTRAKAILARLRAVSIALLDCNLAAYALAVDEFAAARVHLHDALVEIANGQDRYGLIALEHHAVYAGLTGDTTRATVLLGHTDAQIVSEGRTRKTTERFGHGRLRERLKNTVAPDDYDRHVAAGSALTFEQALALAMEIHLATPDAALVAHQE